jgi:dihydrofolate reductase
MIALIGYHGELGLKNDLVFDYPEDMNFFKNKTKGHTVIMGYKTYQSIGRPLPNRKNIVLSRTQRNIPGCETYSSIECVLKIVLNSPKQKFYVIGGETIYEQFMQYADNIILNIARGPKLKNVDTFFPLIEHNFCIVSKTRKMKHSDLWSLRRANEPMNFFYAILSRKHRCLRLMATIFGTNAVYPDSSVSGNYFKSFYRDFEHLFKKRNG